MATVPAGSRLVLRSAGATRVVRALRDVVLVEGCGIPVLGDVAAFDAPEVTVELPTDSGALTLRAVLTPSGAGLVLHPTSSAATVPIQRRTDLRSAVTLPLRGALLPPGPLAGPPEPLSQRRWVDVEGETLDVSRGGVAAHLARAAPLGGTARLYVEFELPDGVPATAVVAVIAQRGAVLRGAFQDITLGDRERLARLVFAPPPDAPPGHRPRLAPRPLADLSAGPFADLTAPSRADLTGAPDPGVS